MNGRWSHICGKTGNAYMVKVGEGCAVCGLGQNDDDDLGHHGPKDRDRTGPGAVPRRMTDAELDQLMAESRRYRTLAPVSCVVSLRDAISALRSERDRLQETLALADKQIEARDEYIKALKGTTP